MDQVKVTKATLYPNPVQNTIHLQGAKVETVEIYNFAGQKIKTLKLIDGKADASALTPGSYILSFQSQGKRQSIKFIKNYFFFIICVESRPVKWPAF